MPTLIFNVTVPMSKRISDATTAIGNYKSTLPNGSPNPETAEDFTLRFWRDRIKHFVREYERTKFKEEAIATSGITDVVIT